MKNKYVIFHVDGGMGKNIMATAVVRAISKTYPDRKIIVVASHEDFWINNPRIERVYTLNQMSYFYRDFIKDNDSIVLAHDPYRDSLYVNQDLHLVEVWCKMFNLIFDGIVPELYYTPREISFIESTYNIKDPFVIIQPHGGAQQLDYSWTRDIPLENGLEIVNYFKQKNLNVFQIKNEKQPLIPGAEALTLPPRHISWLMKYSKANFLIDSFAQHAAAALNVKSNVLWIANSPIVFGYNIHNNIVCNAPYKFETDKYSYLLRFDAVSGHVNEFPFDKSKLFDTNKILGLEEAVKSEGLVKALNKSKS